jgi:hypothetical protein
LVRVTIDRFEEDYAVCADARMETRVIPRAELPPEAKAGDTVFFHDGRWDIDKEETAARAERINESFARIKRRAYQ